MRHVLFPVKRSRSEESTQDPREHAPSTVTMRSVSSIYSRVPSSWSSWTGTETTTDSDPTPVERLSVDTSATKLFPDKMLFDTWEHYDDFIRRNYAMEILWDSLDIPPYESKELPKSNKTKDEKRRVTPTVTPFNTVDNLTRCLHFQMNKNEILKNKNKDLMMDLAETTAELKELQKMLYEGKEKH